MNTGKYYSPLIIYIPICVSVLALPFVFRFTGRGASHVSQLGPQAFWLLLCLGIFVGLVEKLIRLYSTAVTENGLSCIKWGRRRNHSWGSFVKAVWSPLAVRIYFTTGKIEVNFLIVRDRQVIVDRILTGVRGAGWLPSAGFYPPLPKISDGNGH
jgi:hypothetical protein